MNTVELKSDDGKATVWACGKCYMAARTKEDADKCCVQPPCRTCNGELGKGRYGPDCDICMGVERVRYEQARFDKAPKIQYSEYTGAYLYIDDDLYFEDLDTLVDYYYDEGCDPPTWAWACEKIGPDRIDAQEIVEDLMQDGPENVMEQIDQKQVDVLQSYLNTWLELQNIYWYEPTNTIVLFGEEVDKLVAERVAEDKKLE